MPISLPGGRGCIIRKGSASPSELIFNRREFAIGRDVNSVIGQTKEVVLWNYNM